MKIVFLDALTLGDVSLKKLNKLGELILYPTTSPKQTKERCVDADVIITNKVVIDKKIIDSASNLKLITISATGMNIVDVKYAKSKGIEVKNVVGYSTNSVVQHTFAMLFYLLEQLSYYDRYTKSKAWSKNALFTHLGREFYEIRGKTFGIIGLGTIGKKVAKVAKAFGAEIIYYSTSNQNSNDKYRRVDLETLLKQSDFISIHAPLNENTHNLLAKKELKLLKEGAILLNLGRGSIVNEADLAKVLDKKEIFVGLDVTEYEPIAKDNPLMQIKHPDRLLITPHIAWTSLEAREKLVKGIYQNIKATFNG